MLCIKKDVFMYLLAKKGKSKASACRELKISVNTVNNWLHKGIKTPLGKAMYLSEYFGVELETVFDFI